MAQTDAVPRTPLAYLEGDLSAKQLFELIDQFNALVEDTHDFAALMDADTGITETTYEAGLTAAEIDHGDYTPQVASPAPVQGLFGEFATGFVSEELAKTFTEQLDALLDDHDTLVTALNSDGGVTATNFDEAGTRAFRLLARADLDGTNDQDGIVSIVRFEEQGEGHGGILYAFGTPDSGLQPAVYRSIDGGATWLPYSFLPATMTTVAGGVQIGKDLFVAGDDGSGIVVYKSTDFGQSWTEVDPGLSETSTAVLDVFVTTDGTLLLAGDAGGEILRGANQPYQTDLSWTLVTISGPTGINGLGQASNGKVMACGDDAILYSSTDDAGSFSAENDFSSGNPTALSDFLELSNGYWLVTSHVAAGTDELQVSQDEGATWETPVAATGYQSDLGAMIEQNGIVYISATPDVIFSDDLGASVESALDFPANDSTVNCFARNAKGEVLAGSQNTTDFGGLWKVGALTPQRIAAFGVANTGGALLGPSEGQGPDGRWLAWARETYRRALELWTALGAMMDADGDINTTTYEAAIATSALTPLVRSPQRTGPERVRA